MGAAEVFGSAPWVQERIHTGLELAGSCIALGVAGLLLIRVRYERGTAHLLWVVATLVAMGVMDGVHGLLPFGLAWSWLRHLSTLLGGLLFALAWVPLRDPRARRQPRWIALAIGTASLAVSLLVWWRQAWLPTPWTGDGYSHTTAGVNALGGLGFDTGGVYFVRRYLRGGHRDDSALAIHAALFGTSGLVFGLSHVWEPTWWALHACRLLAYVVLLAPTYRMASESFQRLGESNDELERRVAERTRALEASERRVRAITSNAPLLIAYCDPHLTYEFANEAYLDWYGLAPDEMVGRRLPDVLGDVYAQRRTYLERAVGGERVRYQGPMRHRRLGKRFTDTTYIPDRDEQGRVRGIYAFIVDVTEVKEAELAVAVAREELRRHADGLERAVSERTATLRATVEELEGFSYSIAHDMRAPLRAMQGYAQLLEEEQALDERGRQFVTRIQKAAERMDQLIRDVLDYSRVLRSDLPLSAVDAEALLRQVVESYPHLHRPDVTIEVRGPLPRVRANPAALTQVFSNLLGNAVKFVASGVAPHVVVRGERAGDRARIWVQDNGIGMEPEAAVEIFTMFRRLHPSGTYEGTGMGLAIVRKAVERMGGRVGVESAPGAGSRFWIELEAARS